jgi:hypothetical protein
MPANAGILRFAQDDEVQMIFASRSAAMSLAE